jgi:DNA repair protein RadB
LEQTIATGCVALDKLLHGGMECGEMTLLYGEAATGKTTCAIQAATSAARKGMKVVFVDSDNSFTEQRFNQIAGVDAQSLSELIMLFFPDSFENQRMLVESLGNYVSPNLGLVVIDSMSTLYRAAFSKTDSIFNLNRDLARQLAYLADLTLSKRIACLITSQVHTRLKPIGAQIEPVARRALIHFSKTIVRVRNTSNPIVKEFTLERLRGADRVEGRCFLTLSDRGFVEK